MSKQYFELRHDCVSNYFTVYNTVHRTYLINVRRVTEKKTSNTLCTKTQYNAIDFIIL